MSRDILCVGPGDQWTFSSETCDHVEYRFRVAGQHVIVAFDGKLVRHLGDKGVSAWGIMAHELQGILARVQSELPSVERLARALWETDPEVKAFMADVGDYKRRVETVGFYFEMDPQKQARTATLMWERNEGGWRSRAMERASLVLGWLKVSLPSERLISAGSGISLTSQQTSEGAKESNK